ncbi:MAG: RNA polymerase subunit sigma-70 [Verrucomicrobia bacterium]|nr:RNA polymerase subunit sigma-70 [Verrucomicrobiota bacterium]
MADSAVEAALIEARASYGQMLASLAARAHGDVAAAEDALSDAFLAALRQWPGVGVPARPAAWLLAAARRRQVDAWRRQATRERWQEELTARIGEPPAGESEPDDFPDQRLALLFVCAHPAIDAAARAPLCLQVVLGVEVARIASAFLVSPAAMHQRLVRAKTKIRAAGIAFEIPPPEARPARLEAVLDAIYVCFHSGWEKAGQGESPALAEEAIALGRLLAQIEPPEPEALGLLALMQYSQARIAARRGPDGSFVPLHLQDTARWSRPLLAEAEQWMRRAAALGRPGRFQLEAAIQSVHAARAATGRIDWAVIVGLYDALVRWTPAIGARIGRAVALGEVGRADEGLQALAEIESAKIDDHQPFWVAQAALLRQAGRWAEAREALQRGIGLTDEPGVREFLLGELAALEGGIEGQRRIEER